MKDTKERKRMKQFKVETLTNRYRTALLEKVILVQRHLRKRDAL
jgi:hypothetical protein